MPTLHSGGKFSGKAYATSGGLHGVGVSVVNALSDHLEVEVARDRQLFRQQYRQGAPTGKLEEAGPVQTRRGTTARYNPDPNIFGKHARYQPTRLYQPPRRHPKLIRVAEHSG